MDILCVGEILIDLIGQEKASLDQTTAFTKVLGGSPTNVAINTSRLGLQVGLVGSVGQDGFGSFALQKIAEVGIDTSTIVANQQVATSAIIVSKSEETPEFIPYRQADFEITQKQLGQDLLKSSKIFHTTCFALSQDPAQTSILKAAEEAYRLGCQLSIDFNYAPKIWLSTKPVKKIIETFMQWNPLLKISEVDVERIFGEPMDHPSVFEYFHALGVDTICLTLGSKGVKLSHKGEEPIFLEANPLENILDVTGAGDAFWAGFLYAFLKEKPWQKCLEIAQQTAAIKLQRIGHLPAHVASLLI